LCSGNAHCGWQYAKTHARPHGTRLAEQRSIVIRATHSLPLLPRFAFVLAWFAFGCGAGGNGSPIDASVRADGAPTPPIDADLAAPDSSPAPDASDPEPPLTTPVMPLTDTASFYPRAIELGDGTIIASVVAPQASSRLGGTILESTDSGVTFTAVGHIDDELASGGLCCATLFELPAALGALPAGALLWSASVGGQSPDTPMSIPVWSSIDRGRTWARLSTVTVASVPRSQGGLWEPEFSRLDGGALVCHYSDETDAAHSQKLVAARTDDGVSWGSYQDTVAMSPFGARPGMPVVRRPPDGSFVMSYEICGTDGCTARLRMSDDGWNWGDPNDPGLRPTSLDGQTFRHAPTLAWTEEPGRGRFYLVGQLAYAGGGVSGDNGRVLFANTEDGYGNWFTVPAPVPVPDAYDNFCPNYSSAILPLQAGTAVLELASKWDTDSQCRTYFARGPLRGTGDAQGIDSGATYRLRSVQSGMCLDVAGGSTAADANIQQWDCNGLSPQAWTVTVDNGGVTTLSVAVSGMCLTVDGSDAGANVVQRPCDGSDAQRWRIENVGLGYYRLARPSSDHCLDVAGGSTTAGANVQQWWCNDLAPQIWRLEHD